MRGQSPVPPAPTSKPPTPPTARTMDTGTMRKGSTYRTPPAVAPPQVSLWSQWIVQTFKSNSTTDSYLPPTINRLFILSRISYKSGVGGWGARINFECISCIILKVPSNYAPNYPLGHSRRERNSSQSGYGTLPMSHGDSSRLSQSPYNAPAPNGPQVGMVHPLPHGQHGSAATYAPGSASGVYAPGLERQRSYSNPRKAITTYAQQIIFQTRIRKMKYSRRIISRRVKNKNNFENCTCSIIKLTQTY